MLLFVYIIKRFKFVAGDTLNFNPDHYESFLISSELSYIYCFYNSFSVEIYNTSYSKYVSSAEFFDIPLTFKV